VTDPSQLKPDLGRFGAMRDRKIIDSELPPGQRPRHNKGNNLADY
jgi:hypothetical protein